MRFDGKATAGRALFALALLLVGTVVAVSLVAFLLTSPHEPGKTAWDNQPKNASKSAAENTEAVDRFFANRNLTVWWDRDILPGRPVKELTETLASASSTQQEVERNIHPDDYAGPDACKKCHQKNYEAWAEHSHRWMNAMANEESVIGDFSGVEITNLGGTAKFVQPADGKYAMVLERDGVRREYAITQTIGRRFFQYYVGRLKQGPEPSGHPSYQVDHVLPFGFWLDRREWVPAVHVGFRSELPDGDREDPFAKDLPPAPSSPYFQCNSCHATFALGDELTRNFYSLGRHAPYSLHWSMSGYLSEARSELVPQTPTRQVPNQVVESLLIGLQKFEAPDHAVTLGVSCEACHLGCKSTCRWRARKAFVLSSKPASEF